VVHVEDNLGVAVGKGSETGVVVEGMVGIEPINGAGEIREVIREAVMRHWRGCWDIAAATESEMKWQNGTVQILKDLRNCRFGGDLESKRNIVMGL
jgi:hypothetical protein